MNQACLRPYQVLDTLSTLSAIVMLSTCLRPLKSPGHTLLTLIRSHTQHASGVVKSLDTACLHSSQVMLKECSYQYCPTLAQSPEATQMPLPGSTHGPWCSRVKSPQSSESLQLWEAQQWATGATYVSIYLKFKNGWTKQYLI